MPEAPPEPQRSLVLDERRQEAFAGGRRLDLSPTEFALLACLVRHAGQTVTFQALLQEVWGTPLDRGGSLAQVRSTVKRLRQKLVASGHSCQLVGVRGVGYRLDLSDGSQSTPPPRRPLALKVILILIAATLLVVLVAAWNSLQRRGDPTALVWYRQQRLPVGLLWALRRGPHCCVAPDGALYCFDTKEERAAALGVPLPGVDPALLEQLRETGTVPDLRLQPR